MCTSLRIYEGQYFPGYWSLGPLSCRHFENLQIFYRIVRLMTKLLAIYTFSRLCLGNAKGSVLNRNILIGQSSRVIFVVH